MGRGRIGEMEKEKGRWKSRLLDVLIYLLYMLVGGVIGYIVAFRCRPGDDVVRFLRNIVLLSASLYVAVYVQILFHELGHLLGGKISGYRFIFFRFASCTVAKEGGHLRIRRLNVPGTSGQCLMNPPDRALEKTSFVAYFLGGCFCNLLIGGICLAAYGFLPHRDGSLLATLFLCIAIVGILFAFLNGIPLHIGGIANDGMNIRKMSQSADVRQAVFHQTRLAVLLSEGQPLTDFPDSLFQLPSEEADISDQNIASLKMMEYSIRFYQRNYAKAGALLGELYRARESLPMFIRQELNGELLFYYAYIRRDRQRARQLFTGDLEEYLEKQATLENNRILASYLLFVEKDKEQGEKTLQDAWRAAKYSLYPAVVEAEKELLAKMGAEIREWTQEDWQY